MRVCASFLGYDVMKCPLHIRVLIVWEHGAAAKWISSRFQKQTCLLSGRGESICRETALLRPSVTRGTREIRFPSTAERGFCVLLCLGDGLQKSYHSAV